MDLKNMLVDSKSAWVSFPGLSGFEVEIANLSRKELSKLRKRCVTQKFDRKTRQLVETLDEDTFVKEFTLATVKNWRGLTVESLETLLLVNVDGKPADEEVSYSKDNAEVLVGNSTEFDTWLNEVVFDLEKFRRRSDGDSVDKA